MDTSLSETGSQRRRDLDVARELIVGSLIFFHTLRIFDDLDFYVKNNPQYQAVTIGVIFAAFWGMPLLFSIAGFAIWHSLEHRTVGAFVLERVKRLLVPLLVGLLLIAPPQVYYQLCGDPTYQESYLHYYPRFFDIRLTVGFPRFFTPSPDTGRFQLTHLWFLYNLLVYTLLLLPLFLYLRRPAGRLLVERFGGWMTRPGMIFWLALPIAMIEAAFGTDMSGGWNQAGYMGFMIYGYLFAANGRFRQAFDHHLNRALWLALVSTVGGLIAFFGTADLNQTNPLEDYDWASVTLRFVKGFAGWFWLVAILGVLERQRGKQELPTHPRDMSVPTEARPGRKVFLDRLEWYAHQAILPFYLFHQVFIVGIGFYVIQWPATAPVKFLIISLGALATTLFLYEIVVKRTRLTRFLCGMKEVSASKR